MELELARFLERAAIINPGKARARVLLIVVIQATGCCVTATPISSPILRAERKRALGWILDLSQSRSREFGLSPLDR